MKNKLMEGFYLARVPAEDGGSNLVAYGYLSAFKFPDVFDVYTACEVEICKGKKMLSMGSLEKDCTYHNNFNIGVFATRTSFEPIKI